MEVVVSDHIEGDALDRKPIDQMAIARKMPHSGSASVEKGDVSRTHCQERPAHARITDAAAVQVFIVGRSAVSGMLVGIPGVGTPFGLPLAKGIVDAAAPMVSIDLVREGRCQKGDRCRCDTRWRKDVDWYDVLDLTAA
jgi:hypothetical protein